MNKNILLGLILTLALVLRIVDISHNPPALYGDELTLAGDAYSILQTGKDQTGQFLPLSFRMSEGRSPAYVYFSIPFIALFDPTELSVRLLSVLSGVGIVLLLFLLVKEVTNTKVALIAAAFTAISPWEISLSRGGFEAHFGLLLALLGIYTLILSAKNPRYLMIAAISLGLSIHSYHSYKVIIPLLIPILVWFVGPKNLLSTKAKKYLIASVVIFTGFMALWLGQIINGSEIRFQNTNIFSQKDIQTRIIQEINTQRTLNTLPTAIVGLFHNKIISNLFLLGDNYFSNFNPNFLFLHGDGNPRHNPAMMGGFFVAQVILMTFGVIFAYRHYRRLFLFLLLWIALAPVPTTVVSGAHALRSAFMLPPLIILSSLGGHFIWQKSKERLSLKVLLVVVSTAVLIQFIFFVERTYFLSPNLFERFWSVPAKRASLEALENKDRYRYVLISDRIDNVEYAYPLYAKVAPQAVIDQNIWRSGLGNYSLKGFDNVYIGNIPDSELLNYLNELPGPVLYLGPVQQQEILGDANVVNGKDGLPLFITKSKW